MLDLWGVLLRAVGDGDSGLPDILREGVPTGVFKGIQPCPMYPLEEQYWGFLTKPPPQLPDKHHTQAVSSLLRWLDVLFARFITCPSKHMDKEVLNCPKLPNLGIKVPFSPYMGKFRMLILKGLDIF